MNGIIEKSASRREFLRKTGILLGSATLIHPVERLAQAKSREKEEEKKSEEISPPEDLMREHGVLRRILLIYEDIHGRLDSGKEFSPAALSQAAGLVHRFVEDYHERLEEDYLFPRYRKAGKLVELVTVLKEQHKAGRHLTAYITKLAASASLKEPGKRKELADRLHLFITMYRPHAAREDTVLFPALRTIVSKKDFDSLGEQFEEKEEKLFGKGGFETIVAQVADLEKGIGIYDLSRFTPHLAHSTGNKPVDS
jgi:hemerythrin-like domain-containing protein